MKWYKILIVIAVLAGVSTLIPASASKLCYLGYYAHCTFTPISTLICWGIAWGIYRRKLKKN
ncbi:hypothetical protein ES708_33363 [subsurface metagenome]